MPRLDREGWPESAVERIECANCGRQQYADTPAPGRWTYAFERWLERQSGNWRSMQTRLGFMLWCSPKCAWLWRRANAKRIKPAFSHDGNAAKHARWMDEKSRVSGAYGA